MNREDNSELPLLDVLANRRNNGTREHYVYRKSSHTDRYLHKDFKHHPALKQGILTTCPPRHTHLRNSKAIRETEAFGASLPSQRVFEYRNKTTLHLCRRIVNTNQKTVVESDAIESPRRELRHYLIAAQEILRR